MLADSAVPREPELLVRRERAVEKKAGGHQIGVFGIALDTTTAGVSDEVEGPGESCCEDTLAPVTLADKAAGDSPIRQRDEFFLVGGSVLDPWQLVGSSELAPADAVRSVKDKRRMRGSSADAVVLALSIESRVAPGDALGVDADAPASAEDSIVAFHQRREVSPGRTRREP